MLTPSRLPLKDWLALAQHQIKAWDTLPTKDQQGSVDHLKRTMPLDVADAELACRVSEMEQPYLLDIVYSGITPASHVKHFLATGVRMDAETYAAIIRFHERFGLTPNPETHTVLVRHALQEDCSDHLSAIPSLDGPAFLRIIGKFPSILSPVIISAGPATVALLREGIRDAPRLASKVFLSCLRHPDAKSLNILLAANQCVLLDDLFEKYTADDLARLSCRPALPSRLVQTLAVLRGDPEISAHQRVARASLLCRDGAKLLLRKSPDDPLPAVMQSDFDEAGKARQAKAPIREHEPGLRPGPHPV